MVECQGGAKATQHIKLLIHIQAQRSSCQQEGSQFVQGHGCEEEEEEVREQYRTRLMIVMRK